MGIQFSEKERLFKLDTCSSTYIIGIVDEEGFIGHAYYGPHIDEADAAYLMRTGENPFVPSFNRRDRTSFLDTFPMEYPTHGVGDFRDDAISVRTRGGNTAIQLSYVSHEIIPGKKPLDKLPATFGDEGTCTTLEITCEDAVLDLEVILSYTVFEDTDAIDNDDNDAEKPSPGGGPSAWESVQWTDSSEDGSAGPRNGGRAKRGRKMSLPVRAHEKNF